jgi:hypothetical protein
MNPEKITYFGETDSRNKRVKFGIKASDRTRHMYVIGKTGMGKSTLLENLAIQDLQNGEGMAFIDPHGKTAELLLDYIPPERIKDVVYFAPFDTEYPISFNVMEEVGPDKRHLVVSGLMSAFKKLFGEESFSDRMQYILQNTILALLEYPGATMLGINRMLTDKVYRNKVVANVTDSSVKAYWTQEFASYTERFAAEATPAIQNKIGQFTSNPLIRNIIGQPKSSFDFREIMDEGKIAIINLSKGRVGEANANLLGSILITKIYLAAMSRADASEKELNKLPNFYLYVDEFQSFANESFANILSEARKYKLNLTIAHQYIEQMSEEVRAAVFGNVGTMITFRVGAYDAEVLEKEFSPHFTAEDLVSLGIFQMYLKLMIDGVSSSPFSASSLPPFPEPIISYKNEIIDNSRKSFAEVKSEVESTIQKWHDEGKIEPKTQSQGKNIQKINNTFNRPKHTPHGLAPKNDIPYTKIKEQENKLVTPPQIESEVGGEFVPLKDFIKKVIPDRLDKNVENKKISDLQKGKNLQSKNMTEHNLSDLRSALASVMKGKPQDDEAKEPKSAPIKETEDVTSSGATTIEPKVEPISSVKEIPEDDLKKALGLD